MSLVRHLFWINLLLAFSPCQTSCPSLESPPQGTVRYVINNNEILLEDSNKCPTGTIAKLICRDMYVESQSGSPRCLENGTWDSKLPTCLPDCGKRSSDVSLIVNGRTSSSGDFPWHVALYNALNKEHEFWCGGSLISQYAVLTAAHCTWNVKPEALVLAFGKFRRQLNLIDPNSQTKQVLRIEALESYQDASGNYNGDLSVVFLKSPVDLNRFVRPVCLDWNQSLVDAHLTEGRMGTVLGWGLTENETFSNDLKLLQLPVVSDVRCIAQQEKDFRKFITYTSFCAGYANGTGVCNGDSGGGLVFWEEKSRRWYLQGLVSVSPRKRGTPHCDPYYYTVFTKVSLFTKWLRKLDIFSDPNRGKAVEFVAETESNSTILPKPEANDTSVPVPTEPNDRNPYRLIRKYFEKYLIQIGKRELVFPHSQKMLELSKP